MRLSRLPLMAGLLLLSISRAQGQEMEMVVGALDALVESQKGGNAVCAYPDDAPADRYTRLTDQDFVYVANELGVEVAAIKAVVLIETNNHMQGFWAPGVPVVNFDRTMYNRFKPKVASKAGSKNEKVPAGLKGHALSEWTQLINARKSNLQAANMGTFWGMFQIGGFNYKHCGCETIEEFVQRMSESEFQQLELFATFIRKSGMLDDLRKKNWAGFARKFNGPRYAKRGYHTKMAAAYKKIKNQ